MYVGAPYKEIRFKCHVVDDNVKEDVLNQNRYAIVKNASTSQRYVELELDESFDSGKYPLEQLKEHDLGQVQIPARASRRLRNFLGRGDD